ncbi:MAG TPA: NADH-quinone oxidoreductase subunit J [Actinomycetota bacterium]
MTNVAEGVVFWLAAIASIGSAVFMFLARDAVRAALGLVMNLFALAVLFVLLDAHFLAAVQVIVYAGAIMVLFLFVIMLLGVDRADDLTERLKVQSWLAVPLVFGLVAITYLSVRGAAATTEFAGLDEANASGNVEGIGRLLFNEYLFPFEVTSLLLIVAAVGALVIGKRRRASRTDREDEDA